MALSTISDALSGHSDRQYDEQAISRSMSFIDNTERPDRSLSGQPVKAEPSGDTYTTPERTIRLWVKDWIAWKAAPVLSPLLALLVSAFASFSMLHRAP